MKSTQGSTGRRIKTGSVKFSVAEVRRNAEVEKKFSVFSFQFSVKKVRRDVKSAFTKARNKFTKASNGARTTRVKHKLYGQSQKLKTEN